MFLKYLMSFKIFWSKEKLLIRKVFSKSFVKFNASDKFSVVRKIKVLIMTFNCLFLTDNLFLYLLNKLLDCVGGKVLFKLFLSVLIYLCAIISTLMTFILRKTILNIFRSIVIVLLISVLSWLWREFHSVFV